MALFSVRKRIESGCFPRSVTSEGVGLNSCVRSSPYAHLTRSSEGGEAPNQSFGSPHATRARIVLKTAALTDYALRAPLELDAVNPTSVSSWTIDNSESASGAVYAGEWEEESIPGVEAGCSSPAPPACYFSAAMDSPQMYDTNAAEASAAVGGVSAGKKALGNGHHHQLSHQQHQQQLHLSHQQHQQQHHHLGHHPQQHHHLQPQHPQHTNGHHHHQPYGVVVPGGLKQKPSVLAAVYPDGLGGGGGELADLNTPEISLDLQNLIDDSQFGDGLFTDILNAPGKATAVHHHQLHPPAHHPQQHQHPLGLGSARSAQSSASPPTANAASPPPTPTSTPPSAAAASSASSSAASSPCSVASSPGGGNPVVVSSGFPQRNSASSALAYMPQPVHSGANYGGGPRRGGGADSPSVPIKEEPLDPQDFRASGYAPQHPPTPSPSSPSATAYTAASPGTFGGPTFTTLTPSTVPGAGDAHHAHGKPLTKGGLLGKRSSSSSSSSGGGGGGKRIDKSSDEYRRRRERNNIAVRKSREKAKMRSRETEEKVKLLVRENERLQKRIELLTEELNVLRSLFTNVGVLPEHLHRELNKHLESFQQQHQNL
ncbi:hypothetical protein J437_LFUL003122 [Ladona fulva]|uniref:BZIP domain-containing protein n=1 Tax=Ladona fulva TaxID=123851 RepID=A0A8K0PD48_LADFU|nr:hypothetical protein J437_LFUL003122 [Ladona fulva]